MWMPHVSTMGCGTADKYLHEGPHICTSCTLTSSARYAGHSIPWMAVKSTWCSFHAWTRGRDSRMGGRCSVVAEMTECVTNFGNAHT